MTLFILGCYLENLMNDSLNKVFTNVAQNWCNGSYV